MERGGNYVTNQGSDRPVSLDDLEPKRRLRGTISKIGLHGAIVDIGLPYEGLLHISQLAADGEIDAVSEAVEPGDEVTVWVTDVDSEQRRVSLTMVEPPDLTWNELREGDVHSGKVTRVEQYGIFVDIGAKRPGLLHVREMSSGYVEHPSELVSVGDVIDVRVLRVDSQRQRIDLTRRETEQQVVEQPEPEKAPEEQEETSQTAMEVALERAYEDRQEESQGTKRKSKRRRGDDAEREEILERTLKQHSGED
jgi:ribosomal protein S1